MAAESGTNGTVTSTTVSDTAGRSATVHYPGDPQATPPIDPHTEVYENLTAEEFALFDSALDHDLKVDVTVTSGSVTSVSKHK